MGQSKKKGKPSATKRSRQKPYLREIHIEELEAIVERARQVLDAEDHEKLKAAVETLAFLTRELEKKGASIRRLRQMIFGSKTEKTSKVAGDTTDDKSPEESDSDDGPDGKESQDKKESNNNKKKRKGHGRNGASDYTGAEKVEVSHETLKHGDPCPQCDKGKVYVQVDPAVLVRVLGTAPIMARVYECERLRCNLCGEVFTARPPEEVGDRKYDETATSMIGLLKYGSGFPFNRLERLEGGLGIPLPASTQWDVVERGSDLLMPAYCEIVRLSAQGDVLHNDDTTMKILELMGQTPKTTTSDTDESQDRTGIFTSGIVSIVGGHRIALFFTGRNHAGENLAEVLAQRAEELTAPIQMSDMLTSNTAGDFDTIVAGCIAHARRRFVDVSGSFPDEVIHVLKELRKIYVNDAETKKQEMTPEERLRYHQKHSEPVMKALKKWLEEQIKKKKVEPNSGLGEAIAFMKKHWDRLTLFLREPGAPLDNNICERALKKAILHRKNSMFYKTANGARVGDMYMTLIHTAELCGANPFDYLVELQRHHEDVAEKPGDWMPWNYRQTLEDLMKNS